MSRSSIFSFKTLALGEGRPAGMARSFAFALALFVIAEALSRVVLAPAGRTWEYWDPRAAARWEAFRAAEGNEAPEVLFVGDSTAQTNFSHEELTEGLRSYRGVVSLGWPGNYALSFEKSTLPLLVETTHTPRVVVVSLIPTAFVERSEPWTTEAAISSSPFCQRIEGVWLTEDYLYLARWKRALPGLLLDSDNPPGHGFIPPAGKEESESTTPVYKFGTSEISDARFAVLERTARTVQDFGGKFVVVIPPYSGDIPERQAVETNYRQRLRKAQADGILLMFDIREHCDPAPEHFYDYGHLNLAGARLVSAQLASWLEAELSDGTLSDIRMNAESGSGRVTRR